MYEYESPEIINIGLGADHTIAEIALLIKDVTGFNGKLVFDHSKPDGTPRKMLNVDKINALGWHHSIKLEDGISHTYADFESNYARYVTDSTPQLMKT